MRRRLNWPRAEIRRAHGCWPAAAPEHVQDTRPVVGEIEHIFTNIAPAHAGRVAGTMIAAHRGAGDQRGADAQFIEDLEHRNMGEPPCATGPERKADGRNGLLAGEGMGVSAI